MRRTVVSAVPYFGLITDKGVSMAKRQIKFITVPISLWESADLTIAEKHLLIDIDSICDSAEGVAVGTQALASLSSMAQKDVKSALNELYLKGAIDISVDADGAKRIKPYLYKERYGQDKESDFQNRCLQTRGQ